MRALLALVIAAAWPASALADIEAGRKLVEEKRCETCHQRKATGDAGAIYLRKDRRVTSMAKLKSQVAMCNSELNLGLFPDEEDQVVEYLDSTYYRFGSPPSPRK